MKDSTPQPATTDPLNPPCHGVPAINRSDPCPRCGATWEDPCGDLEAREYQTKALADGEAEIVRIEI